MRAAAPVKVAQRTRARKPSRAPAITAVLGVAAWLAMLAAPRSVLSTSDGLADLESPAACSRVEYGQIAPQPDPTANGGGVVEPPNPHGPTIVGVGFFVNDIRGIDPIRDEFQFRGYVRVLWCDPRHAFDPAETGERELVFSGDSFQNELGPTWLASAYPVNKVGELSSSERVLKIRYDGNIEQTINISVPLATHYDLRRFPFDRQTLKLEVESYLWNRDLLQFVHDESISGFSESISMSEWEIEGVEGRVSEAAVMRSDALFSRYTLEVEIARKSGFYLWKVFLPLAVIVAISWSVFWMTEERFAGRSRISATGVLTVVAYQFVFAESLPRVNYLTLLDQVMIGSFGLLAVTVLESLFVDRANRSDPEKALRIDRTSRWLFPAIYATMLAAIALFAG